MQKLMNQISLFNKVKLSMKPLVRITAVLSTLALLSGCAGLLIESSAKSKVSGKTYGEMLKTFPPMKDGNGRLYIYRTETSTKSTLVVGYGLSKSVTTFTVDDTAYELIWETFRYFDLPEGQHEVTCGRDVIKKVDSWTGKRHYQRGVNKVQVSVSNASETFVRLDGTKEMPFFQPIIVKAGQGREEMLNLPYQKMAWVVEGGKISQQ